MTFLPLLVDDRVDGDGGLAGLAVADDQFALAAADRRHGVDGLDAGLQRHVDRLPAGDAGGDRLDRPERASVTIGPLPSSGLPERIDDAADQRLADRHLQQLAGGADLVALGDFEVVAEDDDADRVLFEVEGQAA